LEVFFRVLQLVTRVLTSRHAGNSFLKKTASSRLLAARSPFTVLKKVQLRNQH